MSETPRLGSTRTKKEVKRCVLGAFGHYQTLLVRNLVGVGEVPVPAAAWLFGSALLGLAGIKKRRRA